LLERSPEEIGAHRLESARAAARAAAAVVVLKGDDTIVTDGERGAVNALSAPALATAGTGDALSRLTPAPLPRRLEPFAACCAAALAHARDGREAARRDGSAASVIASDVIDSIPVGMLPGGAVEYPRNGDAHRRRDHGRRRALRHPRGGRPPGDRPARQDRAR